MILEDSFTLAQPTEPLWTFLLDVQRVAPCMPGAELTETIDDRNWKGKVSVRFGPVAMVFAGAVQMTERDDGAHRVSVAAKGMEEKGKGVASAVVTSWLEPAEDGSSTTVKLRADITLSGAIAQLSRGLLPEVSRKLTKQFADCLEQTMGALGSEAGSQSPDFEPHAPKHVRGLSLGLSAIWAKVIRFFRKLFVRK